MKVELGPGTNKRFKNSVGIDLFDSPGVDIVADLNKGLPFFSDSSVDEIYSHHLLEHISNFTYLMEEVYRVLRPGGTFRGEVPHFSNPYFYSDPTHKIFFGLYSFNYFVKNQSSFQRKVPVFYNDLNFEVVSYQLIFKNSFKNILSKYKCIVFTKFFNKNFHRQEKFEWYFSKLISCYEISFVLRKPFK